MPALILIGPPTTALLMFYLMQAVHMPEPFAVIIQYGALGLIAWWLKRLVERLLDQAEKVRAETAADRAAERARFDALLQNNTAALARNSDSIGQLDEVVRDLTEHSVCPLRENPPVAGLRRQKHGD